MAHLLSSRVATPICPRTAGLTSAPRVVRTRLYRAAMANDQPLVAKDGIAAGAVQWPPRPITEHGQPNKEDDPNPDIDAGAGKAKKLEAVAGPPPEVEAKQDSPKKAGFSEPRSGGTQQGGGGEGSAS